MGQVLTKYIPALTWALLTAVALLMPGDPLQETGAWFDLPEWLELLVDKLGNWLEPWADKLVHFGLFLVLAFLVRRSFYSTSSDSEGAVVKTLAVTLSYIVILEIAQIWIPGRGWETMDLVAGFAGAVAALLLLQLKRPLPSV
jgi:VanZ family protein